MENLSPEMNSDHRSETALPVKRKRNLPGMPDPDSEVIALSPETLMATNRFVCEVCYKGFQRDQNLQLHRRGHNLPWKLRQRSENEVIRKRVYVCPEISCVHHDPSRALGDLTGIKKHFCRKHGEKKYKCDRCSKAYAVQSDRKAHMKTCGTREYRCECGTLFSRRDSFITHRAFCGALAQESVRPQGRSGGNERFYPPPSFLPSAAAAASSDPPPPPLTPSSGVLSPELSIQSSAEPRTEKETKTADIPPPPPPLLAASPTSTIATASGSSTSSGHLPITTNRGFFSRMLHATTSSEPHQSSSSSPYSGLGHTINPTSLSLYTPSLFQSTSQSPRSQPVISATALLQKAAEMGSTSSTPFLHHLWAAPPPSAVDSITSSHDQSRLRTTSNKSYNESLPKTGGTGFHSWGGSKILGRKTRELASPSTNVKQLDNNSMASGLGLGLHSSELFGDKPTTLDFLGLGMGGSQPSSGGFTAFLSSIGGGLDMAAPPPYGGETWEEPSKRKPSLL